MAFFRGKGSSKLHAGSKTSIIRHTGKNSTQELLPDRHAMATLTGSPPSLGQRSMNQYAKLTPSMEQTAPSPGTTPSMDGSSDIL